MSRIGTPPSRQHRASEWFRPLIESTADPITVVSLGSGRIVDVNSAFTRSMDFKRQEVVGRTPTEIGFVGDRAAYDRVLAARSATSSDELEFRTRDGDSRIAQISRMAIEVAGQACVIVVWRDITERKQFEKDMVRARDLALESAQLKSDFLSNISHELRTPLHGIIGMSELLSRTQLTPEQQEYSDTIEQSTQILLKLVTDILDFSTASSGKLRFERIGFSLRDVVQMAVSMYAVPAAGKGLKLVSSIDTAIPNNLIGDPYRLGQVLTNLLNNAIKFTHSGTITVRTVSEKVSDESIVVRFEVQDTGIGISPADQERVFQPFIQADGSTTRKYGGTGLGLAICTRLVSMMGGDIGVRSAPDNGSVFHFTACFARAHADSDLSAPPALQDTPKPAVVAAERAPAADAGVQAEKERVRILIVEDNLVNQTVLQRQLKKLGYQQVTVAENGQEALEILNQAPYDIVLMDCQMPVMGGNEAAVLIRNRERGDKHTIIVAVTGKAMPDDREKCLACGMDDYISKPIRLETLAKVLERYHSRRGVGSNGPAAIVKDPHSVRLGDQSR